MLLLVCSLQASDRIALSLHDADHPHLAAASGYYTRSGYVPGPICKYNWTKVWDVVERLNARLQPPARIFSYLTVNEGQHFPGRLACNNRGSLKKLEDGENLISQVRLSSAQNYSQAIISR